MQALVGGDVPGLIQPGEGGVLPVYYQGWQLPYNFAYPPIIFSAAVAYDAVESAVARGSDVLIIDTAGRLHTQTNLMEELCKIDRVTGRLLEGAPHQRLLVVDATTGQNVLNQVREFGRGLPLSGVVLTKYDSSARGGTAVAVSREFGIPVRYLGTGEGERDLETFDSDTYLGKLLG